MYNKLIEKFYKKGFVKNEQYNRYLEQEEAYINFKKLNETKTILSENKKQQLKDFLKKPNPDLKKTSKIILFNTFKLFDFLGYFKDFRFLSSYFSIIYFCFLLLGREKNILFITCWDNFSCDCLYFF